MRRFFCCESNFFVVDSFAYCSFEGFVRIFKGFVCTSKGFGCTYGAFE